MSLPSHVVDLLEHAARHPEGGLALLDAELESCAALYQLHPTEVERARRACESPERRREAEHILSRPGASARAPSEAAV